jgi:hypothetical protein
LASARRLGVVVGLVALLASVAGGTARADGDPASDYLYVRSLFVPFDSKSSKGAQEALATAIAEAKRSGYPIRVALIEQPSDLGSVTSLWGKPKDYAKFLDFELSIAYKGPLLIVMPSGIGFAHLHTATASEYRALTAIPVESGNDGLARTATTAVVALAARAGHRIKAPAVPRTSSSSGVGQRAVAGGVALAVVAVIGGAFALVRTRRARH